MRELYIDFDGVIMNTIEVSYKMLEDLGKNPKNPEDSEDFYRNLKWKDFIKECQPINNSIECIQKIIDSNQFRVSILTHVNGLEEAVVKVDYIRQYFDDITVIPVPRKISKTQMVHTKKAILIDDYAGNLREWSEAGGIGVRFSEKRNGKGFPVVDYLDQIIEMFEEEQIINN